MQSWRRISQFLFRDNSVTFHLRPYFNQRNPGYFIRPLTRLYMEGKVDCGTKPAPDAGKNESNGVIKTASQLKKEAKRQAKLDKFNKKKEQEAEKKNQGEVRVIRSINKVVI